MAGLAESMVQQPQQPQPTGQAPTIQEVIELLMQGTPPEELEQMGIPPEMIMEAITMIEQQLAAQGQQQPAAAPAQMGGGLAQQMVSGR